MVRKRDSIKQKVREVFNASPTQQPVENAVDDTLEDDLFAQLDAKDDAEQTSAPTTEPQSQTQSIKEEGEAEQLKKSRKAKREVGANVVTLHPLTEYERRSVYRKRKLSDRLHLLKLTCLRMRNWLRKLLRKRK